MKTAVTYSRVSTREQAKRDLSIPYQKGRTKEYAEQQGYVVIGEFVDAGKTATDMKREGLQDMLQFMKEKKVNAIVVYKQDRLSRSMADFWNMYGIFEESGVEFLSTTEKFAKGPQSILNLGISSTFAMYYSAELSQNVRRGHTQKVKNGWFPNTAPIGYENYGEKPKRYIRPHKTDAELVKQAFELFATGDYSITDLTEVMEKKGMKTQRGSSIARSSISRMLKNPIYYGDFMWKGKIHKGKHIPIISKELFDMVQEILEYRRVKGVKNRKNNFMLRGHVYCSCGSRLVGELTTKSYRNGTRKQYSYFGCKSRKKNKKCTGKYIKMSLLEEKVADIFKNIEFTEEFKKEVLETAKEIVEEVRSTETKEEKLIKQRITKTKSRMENAENDRFDRLISRDEFADVYNRLKEDLAEAT